MIKNAKDVPLNKSSGTVPNMGDAIRDWFQQLIFTRVTKTVVDFQEVETKVQVPGLGVIQPMSAEQLRMKPDGQTSWKWYTVHADPSLILSVDEIIVYLNDEYRVMGKTDYSLYGYVYYELVQDYKP